MKKFYSVVLSVAVLLVLSGGVASAQTTSEPTTEKLEDMVQQLQQRINDLQQQVNNQEDEEELEQADTENEDGNENETDDDSEDTEATSSSNQLPEQAAAQAGIARQLDQGDRGPDVRQLQELLASNSEIYPEGLVTGYYGPLTAQAVSRLQERAGLPSVGRVGPRTRSQINTLLNEGAGQSGVIPPGLLQASGLQGQRGNTGTSGSATSSETTEDPSDEEMRDEDDDQNENDDQERSRGQRRGPDFE